MKSYCKDCNNDTNHEVLAEHVIEDSEDEVQWWETKKYQIIKCKGCDRIQFRLLSSDATFAQHAEPGAEWEEDIYPKYDKDQINVKDFRHCPPTLIKLYKEIIKSYNSGHLIITAIGIRAFLEGICNDKNVQGGMIPNQKGELIFSLKLIGKVNGLIERGLFSKENKDVLDSLRIIGNDAAHDLKSPSEDGLKDAISIIEHAIEHIYELKMKSIK
jgi:hypothetical protein